MTFSELVIASGLTQREIAKAAGITPMQCQRLINGQTPMSAEMRRRLMPILQAAQAEQSSMLEPFRTGDQEREEELRITALYGCRTSWQLLEEAAKYTVHGSAFHGLEAYRWTA